MPLAKTAIATAFSRYDYEEVEPYFADEIVWDLVGGAPRIGARAVFSFCRETLGFQRGMRITFREQRVIDGGDMVAVDSLIEYVHSDGAIEVVMGCDIFQFENDLLTHVRTYSQLLEG